MSVEKNPGLPNNFNITPKLSYNNLLTYAGRDIFLTRTGKKIHAISADIEIVVTQAIVGNINELFEGTEIPVTELLEKFSFRRERQKPLYGSDAIAKRVSLAFVKKAYLERYDFHSPEMVLLSGELLRKTNYRIIENAEKFKEDFPLGKNRQSASGISMDDAIAEEDRKIATHRTYQSIIEETLHNYRVFSGLIDESYLLSNEDLIF